MAYQPIENYGVIGDLYTVALVGMDGSIDYMCFPEFDSPSLFARLLDDEHGGFFRLAPVLEGARQKQLYLPDTNVLLSRFLSSDGVAEISDFMPVEEIGEAHNLIRRAKTIRGQLEFRMECEPAFDYGRTGHRIERESGDAILFIPNSDEFRAIRLRSQVPMEILGGRAVAVFSLADGENAAFVLEDANLEGTSPSSSEDYVSRSFKDTVNFWRTWIGKSNYTGRWREMVNRSALTLKMLTSARHGTIVAAPTFGLPEQLGGERNWDYRYTWIRDASFTLYALIRLGYTEEAARFMDWIEARCRETHASQGLQTMYAIDGHPDLSEEILDNFEGYKKSSPVRIGNAAYQQLQLDIYGELMDSVYLYDKYGHPISHDLWQDLVRLVDWVCQNWNQPDEGIWEIRSGKNRFLYSRLMCWVALDRAVRLAAKRSFPAPSESWKQTRDEIYRDIFDNFWDADQQAFVQRIGAKTLDASSLLMPLVRFISPVDPRWKSHLAAIERELVHDSLVYRYNPDESADGLTGNEGTFSMCSFWYVECLSRSGDLDKARFYFEKMLGYANHLGLYAEELGPRAEHLGNFPQAFTHLALISAAYDLNRRLSHAGWEA
jgi:GH15 family glucan-1,4-alpha-glucosidase